MKIDLDQIRKLLDIISETEVTELTVQEGQELITIKRIASSTEVESSGEKALSAGHKQSSSNNQLTKEEHQGKSNNETNGLIAINSPMVGTFYRSSAPETPPFVQVGDVISPGQTVCIIEAMKLMNDLPAEIAGRIVRVCVENGTTVEYGQPLFMVNPQV